MQLHTIQKTLTSHHHNNTHTHTHTEKQTLSHVSDLIHPTILSLSL